MKISDNHNDPDAVDLKTTGGVIVIDKPPTMSSMTAVAIIRRKSGVKAGHAGTLDPLASGVLVIGVGKATKSLERFMKTRKIYRTIIDLSAFTPTDDREGEKEIIDVAQPPTLQKIDETLQANFSGAFMQTPPNFSAKKIGGQRAYALARKGEQPKLEPREVLVHAIASCSYDWPLLEVEVECRQGFYVRSLARNLGEQLGTGGHCAAIKRIGVGPFTIDEAQDPDKLPMPLGKGAFMSLENALERLAEPS